MAKLSIEAFSDDFRETAPMECAVYLYECLEETEKKRIKDDWNNAGGRNIMPWWKWCMEHIEVNYSR